MREIFKNSGNEMGEIRNKAPYVVSADIFLLLKKWADKHNFILPKEDFFLELRRDFVTYAKTIFSEFELVSEESLSQGLSDLVSKTGLFPVSLDGIYYDSVCKLEITRLVDENLNDKGLARRFGTNLLYRQFKETINLLRQKGIKEIALIDDVIFSGNLIERVCKILENNNINIPVIIAGIGITAGLEKFKSNRQVYCVKEFNEVIDEVCERDFYPGVPQSGRLVAGNENLGVPYLRPFGKPEKWASIPEKKSIPFSYFCISKTIKLFKAIEKETNRIVRCDDLGRQVFPLQQNESRCRYVDVLKQQVLPLVSTP